MMTKKHYIRFTQILSKLEDNELNKVILDFLNFLKEDNPQFNKEVFLNKIKELKEK